MEIRSQTYPYGESLQCTRLPFRYFRMATLAVVPVYFHKPESNTFRGFLRRLSLGGNTP